VTATAGWLTAKAMFEMKWPGYPAAHGGWLKRKLQSACRTARNSAAAARFCGIRKKAPVGVIGSMAALAATRRRNIKGWRG